MLTGQHPTLLLECSLFAFESAFPAAGLFPCLEQVHDHILQRPRARIMVFGHADIKGDEAYDKKVSERRAKATLAWLQRDSKLLDEVCEAEDWGVAPYQAMLRVLGCNPGDIDGIEGPMTQSALRGFQREYNDGVCHDYEDAPPRAHGNPTVDGELGSQSKAALRDAYVAQSPCAVPADRFNTPAFAGCSEPNPVGEEDDKNRRVMIALRAGHQGFEPVRRKEKRTSDWESSLRLAA